MRRIFMGICAYLTLLLAPIAIAAPVQTGLDRLVATDFAALRGKKVGLITNPTGVDRKLHSTVDIFATSKSIRLVALFGPEHGLRGDHSAGDKVSDSIDPMTRLPVHSLYGLQRKPSAAMLAGLDALVFDIQDIGVRSYTYLATLGLAMEAAAENGVEFVVLDRPNPLGGLRVEGPLPAEGRTSFVAPYPIPYVHGLTVGELATLINESGWLTSGLRARLTVIPMRGWRRHMTFEMTGLPWVPSSPHIPQAATAALYPATGIMGELSPSMIGIGYTLPFGVMAAANLDAETYASAIRALDLPGVQVRPVYFTPYYSSGAGQRHGGAQIYLNLSEVRSLSLLQFQLMEVLIRQSPQSNPFLLNTERWGMFDKVVADPSIRAAFTRRWSAADVEPLWKTPAEFVDRARSHHLYR
ncbi:MAG: DUF1343 domain-containing protein [Gammaproteobacteria bacterium]|nr:DUF1343 domain-containing protein [Gammaproteobacteria bacterium]